MKLNFEILQNYHYESMRQQAKTRSEKCLEHNQLSHQLRDIFSPWRLATPFPK
jgi:hypothetical protein